jgi:hypothetical protein
VSIIEVLINKINAGEPYLNTGLKNLLIGAEVDATAVETGIKILDKNYNEVFGARAAWSLLICLFSVSILETISQSLWMSCPNI